MRDAYGMIEDRRGDRNWAVGKSFSMTDCAAAPALSYASSRYFRPATRTWPTSSTG
ncbi:hypothetical protein C8R31_102100 [Nitrosospira sp. Nsp2]|uniref:glutathione S-transferase C-terminal domain-containing protein n=1 Tax=Nitrosospira sp. Nsp2 TaxID=136548 RepID=UPI000D4839B6|nr:glutathione S-transferase domain-containing protein [Nitrosospira sp. Nsp2]PTR16086.1 hypothetical protein C8R31_102100 [Nitrosospira sp. Nsp2]